MNRRMYRFDSNGEMGEPWGVPRSGVPVGRRPFPVTVSIVFLDRCFQPLLDEVQNVPINNPTGYALHQFSVRNAVKIA